MKTHPPHTSSQSPNRAWATLLFVVLLIATWSSLFPQAFGQPLKPASAEPASLEVVRATVHTSERRLTLDVEVARTSAERSRGLMEREHLAADSGMLFLYDSQQAANNGFWMYRTLIPLDIAFLDEEGRVAAMHRMVPCGSERPADCPVTTPGVPYHAALEVNAGYFDEHGVDIGDHVRWSVP